MERETGIEPATNSLEGCDSTTELLPLKTKLSAISRQLKPAAKAASALDSQTARLKPRPSTNNLEPMTRIELVTSPLPRECSTN
jgi:hypothetical protein